MRALTPNEKLIAERFRATLREALARDLEEDRRDLTKAQCELAEGWLRLARQQHEFLEELRDEVVLIMNMMRDNRTALTEWDHRA